jgi:hypothetical protein
VARFVPVRRSTALIAAAVATIGVGVPAGYAAVHPKQPHPAIYLVGGGVESINPTADMLANDDFYLGGYGFASGHPGNVTALPSPLGARFATGILGDKSFNRYPSPDGTYESDGSHSRAFAVSDKKATTILAQIETQGYFDAYKQGPFGENEIRKDAAAAIAALAGPKTTPAPTASQIVVDSDHSHGGPDTAGVWGGVPTSYLVEVHDQTVKAIVDAWKAMRPATLTYGIAHAGVVGNNGLYPPQECLDAGKPDCQGVANPDWLLHNQFDTDPNNFDMDDEIRVFQARDPKDEDKVLDTYVNYASHPTVLGSSNTKVTGDYVGRLNVAIEKAFGGFGMDQVGTLGREQPERASCTDPAVTGQDAQNLCSLDQYASRVVTKIKDALSSKHATALTGDPIVSMNSYFLSDTTTNAVLLAGEYAGQAIGAPFGRANTAPWYTGSQLGTTYFVGRIGSVLITGGPGEMYAQIWQKVKDTVTADKSSGITSVLNIGTAGDFLGYIIAPLEAYPEPAKASLFSGDDPCNGVPDPAKLCPSPIDNDNYFFNISHTFGERLTCDFLRGAGDVVAGDSQKYWSTYDRCPAFVNDFVAPEGLDTTFPDQPDLYSTAHPAFDHM